MLEELGNPAKFEEVRRRLILIAGFKYRIRECDAEDIAQTALAAYCEHGHRYRNETNQMGILIGIFKKKCLEFIDQSIKTTHRLKRIAEESTKIDESPFKPERGGTARPVIDQVIRREDGTRIVEALQELKPQARELFELLIEEDVGRHGLMKRLKLKANTLDSRIRSARLELRGILKARGICI